jgi:hypothetical protein
MTSNLGSFVSKYHGVANARLTIEVFLGEMAAAHNISCFNSAVCFARLTPRQQGRSTSVDLALKLDMLVMLAVFTFVGSDLLGAF